MRTDEAFLALTRLGLGHHSGGLEGEIDWTAVQTLASEQGLTAVVLDGVGRLPENKRPLRLFLLEWIGNMLESYEQRYELFRRTIVEMAGFYNSHGLKMMVLKGYACSLDWPKPERRPCGDIDIWLFGEQKKADSLLMSEKGIKVDKSHHHHTVFMWGEVTVENHFDFVNIYHHKSNVELEKIFKKLGQDDTHYISLDGEKVYLPSSNLHALFLLKHTMNDFTSFSMSLRQLLDWAFFVERHGKEVNWTWLIGVLKKYNMLDFYNTINAICVRDLGFDMPIFSNVHFNPDLKVKVLNDILHPKFTADEPSYLIPRLAYKYKRWKGNSWKHQMCYNESLWSAFWSGVWSHMLKPSTI